MELGQAKIEQPDELKTESPEYSQEDERPEPWPLVGDENAVSDPFELIDFEDIVEPQKKKQGHPEPKWKSFTDAQARCFAAWQEEAASRSETSDGEFRTLHDHDGGGV